MPVPAPTPVCVPALAQVRGGSKLACWQDARTAGGIALHSSSASTHRRATPRRHAAASSTAVRIPVQRHKMGEDVRAISVALPSATPPQPATPPPSLPIPASKLELRRPQQHALGHGCASGHPQTK